MTEIFGIPTQALFGQLLIGLINGSFYALLSLGLAVIFGLLNIINFTHGAQYMMGAFCAYFLMTKLGIGYWWALVITPLAVGIIGMVIERLMLARLYKLDHLYGLLLTFGLALIIQGLFRNEYGTSGIPYAMPQELSGGRNLGFMFLPNYRAWVILASIVMCLATWFVIERTQLGSYLRAATENPALVQAFGINVPRMITLTYGFGVALAALAPLVAYPVFLMKVMCFALFACAFNLLIGYGGLLSFGHAMFLGTAGYASAHAAKVWGFPPELAILFGTACSALLGLVTGLLAIRRQGIYFAMITLALAQMVYFFYLQAPFTGGADGLARRARDRVRAGGRRPHHHRDGELPRPDGLLGHGRARRHLRDLRAHLSQGRHRRAGKADREAAVKIKLLRLRQRLFSRKPVRKPRNAVTRRASADRGNPETAPSAPVNDK